MKKFLLYLTGLLAVLIAALLINDAVWFSLLTTSTGSSAYKIYRIYGHHPADEIPIFGSSRAQAHFDPDLIGPNCFNYGLDGSGQNETLDLVETYVRSTPTPTTYDSILPIIINLDPWGFPSDNATHLSGDYGLVGDSIIGLRSFGKIRSVLASWLNERISGTKKICRGAVIEKISRSENEWKVINAKTTGRPFKVSNYWKNRITHLAMLSNRPIYWVVGPFAPHRKSLFKTEPELNAFCDWLSMQPNQHVINLYSLPYDNSYFMDPTHLNIKGADDFTKRVKSEIYASTNVVEQKGEK